MNVKGVKILFQEPFLTIENIQFDLPFEISLFRSKYESFADETFIDEWVLRPYISEHHSVDQNFDKKSLQQFEKLEDLVTNLDQAIHKYYIQQSVELSSLSFLVSSPITQSLHLVSTSSTSSTISTTSPLISKSVIHTILIPSTSTPHTSSSVVHPHISLMEA